MSAQKCPFDAIMIINLPKNLEKETTHRYGPNSFKLHRRGSGASHSHWFRLYAPDGADLCPAPRRLPVPRPAQVLGLVGTNGALASLSLPPGPHAAAL